MGCNTWRRALKGLLLSCALSTLANAGSLEKVVEQNLRPNKKETIRVGMWNLETYGPTKAFGHEGKRRELIAEEIKDYDLMVLQEIRDSQGNAVQALCKDLEEYNCAVSSPAGNAWYKEQILFAYRPHIELLKSEDNNPDERWERPPVIASFVAHGARSYPFNIATTHIDLHNVASELRALERLVSEQSGNWIVGGDFNQGCDYIEPNKTFFEGYQPIVTKDMDTTTTGTDCPYDRLNLNRDAQYEFLKGGVYDPHPGLGPGQSERLSNHRITGVTLVIHHEQLP